MNYSPLACLTEYKPAPTPRDHPAPSGLEGPLAASLADSGQDSLQQPVHSPTIMIVDDERLNIDLVQAYLQEAGYVDFCSTTDSVRAVDIVRHEHPDIVLLDLMMPEVDGFDILTTMRRDTRLQQIPVVVLTAASDAQNKLKALELGATDFLAKPVDPSELVLRLRNALAAKAYQDHLETYSTQLEQQVQRRTGELEAARQEILRCLARAAEYRDDDTGHHIMRVGRYVAILARKLGLNLRCVDCLEQAAQLHDVGKIGIPDSILLKPGKLSPGEFDFMKQHCKFGRLIIQPISEEECEQVRQHTKLGARIIGATTSPVMKLAATIAMTHHERWDGSGYPCGLAGEQIPIEGRITAVADVFDALSSKRPYKPAFPQEKCLAILEEGRGTQFDPQVLDAFFACIDKILAVQEDLADPE